MALRLIRLFKDLLDAPAPEVGKFLRWGSVGKLENTTGGATGSVGPPGAKGDPGPSGISNIDATSPTTLMGLLLADGGLVKAKKLKAVFDYLGIWIGSTPPPDPVSPSVWSAGGGGHWFHIQVDMTGDVWVAIPVLDLGFCLASPAFALNVLTAVLDVSARLPSPRFNISLPTSLSLPLSAQGAIFALAQQAGTLDVGLRLSPPIHFSTKPGDFAQIAPSLSLLFSSVAAAFGLSQVASLGLPARMTAPAFGMAQGASLGTPLTMVAPTYSFTTGSLPTLGSLIANGNFAADVIAATYPGSGQWWKLGYLNATAVGTSERVVDARVPSGYAWSLRASIGWSDFDPDYGTGGDYNASARIAVQFDKAAVDSSTGVITFDVMNETITGFPWCNNRAEELQCSISAYDAVGADVMISPWPTKGIWITMFSSAGQYLAGAATWDAPAIPDKQSVVSPPPNFTKTTSFDAKATLVGRYKPGKSWADVATLRVTIYISGSQISASGVRVGNFR